MSIQSKNWKAQINRMPGDKFFRTTGTVTVANPGVTPKLVFSALQDKSFDLRLELVLETGDGIALQVLTDKQVEYKVAGDSYTTGVSIFFEGELIHHIKTIDITQ